MTVRQIIQEIDALPAEERMEVLSHLAEKEAPPAKSKEIRYASKEEVKRASEKIFTEYADLFRKLAQ